MLIEKHKKLSIIKTIVFSYLIKKESLMSKSLFKVTNEQEIVCKYLSILSGDTNHMFYSVKYILKSIHILILNRLLTVNGSFLTRTNNSANFKFAYEETGFANKVIEKAKTMSDKQFMREVLSNV